MSNFRVGQKVVCVDAGVGVSGYVPPIKNGAVYTITKITSGHSGRGPDVGLQFAEVQTMPEFPQGYTHSRFRPVVERKTSIEVFKAMLNKPRVSVDA